jgi:uncharacterized protein
VKIAVVGFGAASIGFIDALKGSEHEIHVFERSKDVNSSSLSGIRSDGKLIVSNRIGGDLDVTINEQESVVAYYLRHLKKTRESIEQGTAFKNHADPLYQQFYAAGFDPVEARTYHAGTDELGQMMGSIYKELKQHKNIHFHFDHQIDRVIRRENPSGYSNVTQVTYELVGSDDYGMFSSGFDSVIVGAGRSGVKLVNQIAKDYPELLVSNTNVDLGIRFELPNHIVHELNEKMYEFKLRYRTKAGFIARTFCNNPGGKVVSERYNNGDFMTVNGHAEQVHKTDNTNFAVLVTHVFTEPFNDPYGYGSYIAKLSNLLAGGKKVILQTYGDFKDSRRTKRLGRVTPTLNESEFILGDLSLVLPARTAAAITDFIDQLNVVVPGIANSDNLVYGVEVKFYSSVMNNEKYPTLKFIGDCSGWTRSITYATAHGRRLAESFL